MQRRRRRRFMRCSGATILALLGASLYWCGYTVSCNEDPFTHQPKDSRTGTESAGDETNYAVKRPRITSSTWAVAASTPFGKPENIQKGFNIEPSNFAPYVHWVCFHQQQNNNVTTTTTTTTTTMTKQKVECCRQIFQLMEYEPLNLCWSKLPGGNGNSKQPSTKCIANLYPAGRSEFLSYCTTQLATIPPTDDLIPLQNSSNKTPNATAKNSIFQPRFSLLELPPPPANARPFPHHIWRQYLWFSGQSEQQTGQWYAHVQSPMHLAMDPTKPQPKPSSSSSSSSSANDPNENADPAGKQPKKISGVFGTTFVTNVTGDDEEEEVRILHHKISTNLIFHGYGNHDQDQYVSTWKARLRVFLFVPVGIQLASTTKSPFGPCRTTTACGKSRSCTVSLPSSSLSSNDMDHQQVIPILVQVQGSSKGKDDLKTIPTLPRSSTNECELGWTTRLILDDPEEDLLLAAPVIHGGQLRIASKIDQTAETNVTTYQWRLNGTFPTPLTTNLNVAAVQSLSSSSSSSSSGRISDEL